MSGWDGAACWPGCLADGDLHAGAGMGNCACAAAESGGRADAGAGEGGRRLHRCAAEREKKRKEREREGEKLNQAWHTPASPLRDSDKRKDPAFPTELQSSLGSTPLPRHMTGMKSGLLQQHHHCGPQGETVFALNTPLSVSHLYKLKMFS